MYGSVCRDNVNSDLLYVLTYNSFAVYSLTISTGITALLSSLDGTGKMGDCIADANSTYLYISNQNTGKIYRLKLADNSYIVLNSNLSKAFGEIDSTIETTVEHAHPPLSYTDPSLMADSVYC